MSLSCRCTAPLGSASTNVPKCPAAYRDEAAARARSPARARGGSASAAAGRPPGARCRAAPWRRRSGVVNASGTTITSAPCSRWASRIEILYAREVALDLPELEGGLDDRDPGHAETSSATALAGSGAGAGRDDAAACGGGVAVLRPGPGRAARARRPRGDPSRRRGALERKRSALQLARGSRAPCAASATALISVSASRALAAPEGRDESAREAGRGRDLLRRAGAAEEVAQVRARSSSRPSRTSSQSAGEGRSMRVSALAKW